MQTDPTASGPRFLGKYEVLARLDSGGMAEIFLARARGLAGFEKLVVLKRILPHLAAEEEFVSMFLVEAKTTVALSHGNIVQVFDMGKGEEGDYFIAMEYVAGKNLRRYLRRSLDKEKVPIEPPLAAWIASEILRGLDYAHRRTDSTGKPLGIVHRDLSPHNILISYEGEVKVADFGIAKAAGKVVHTETGLIRGKASYMSPEQARAEDLDGRSDIFSTGILLYELLTGSAPYEGESSDAILRNVLKGPPPPPSSKRPNISAELDTIVLKALATRREDRYETCDLLLKDLGTFLQTAGVVVGPRDLAARMSSLFAEDVEDERRQLAALPKSTPAPTSPGTPVLPAGTPSAGSAANTRHIAEERPGLLAPWPPNWARVTAGIAVASFFLYFGLKDYILGNPRPTPTALPTETEIVRVSSPIPTETVIVVAPSPTTTAKSHPTPQPKSSAAAQGSPVPTTAVVAMGQITVQANPWAFVFLDGVPVRVDWPLPTQLNEKLSASSTPIRNFPAKAGRHHLRVEQWDLDKHAPTSTGESDIEVKAGETSTYYFTLAGDRFVRSGS